jgi:hypothetical protein
MCGIVGIIRSGQDDLAPQLKDALKRLSQWFQTEWLKNGGLFKMEFHD